jgi:hypothetical protein
LIEVFHASTNDRREFKLAWSIKRAREVRLDNEEVAAKGQLVIRPAADMTFTLKAVNKSKTST